MLSLAGLARGLTGRELRRAFPLIASLFLTMARSVADKAERGALFLDHYRAIDLPYVDIDIAVLVGIAGFILLPPLTTWLFTERYAEAAEYGKWLWLSLSLTNPITTYLGTALIATKRPIFLYGSHIGYSLLMVALFLALVHAGLGGMVMARIVGGFCLAGFYVAAFLHLRKQGLRSEAKPSVP